MMLPLREAVMAIPPPGGLLHWLAGHGLQRIHWAASLFLFPTLARAGLKDLSLVRSHFLSGGVQYVLGQTCLVLLSHTSVSSS